MAGNTTATSRISCPSANNQVFVSGNLTSSGSSRRFRVSCDVDYNSSAGAVELACQPADSINACIDACAADDECTAAGWGNYFGVRTCFMKGRLGAPNVVAGWYFAEDVTDN